MAVIRLQAATVLDLRASPTRSRFREHSILKYTGPRFDRCIVSTKHAGFHEEPKISGTQMDTGLRIKRNVTREGILAWIRAYDLATNGLPYFTRRREYV